MKKIYLSIVLLLFVLPMFAQLSRTIDHTTADIHSIPDNWIDSAKAKLDIVYWRASHGSQLTNGGMNALRNYSTENAALYNFSENGGDGVLKLVEFLADLEHENDVWVSMTEDYLDSHPEVNTVMWAWCDIVDHIVHLDLDQYLADMEMLIAKYGPGGTENRANPVTFVFMSAHTYPYVDYGEEVYNANLKIKTHSEENDRWFYDFYDLECFDPDENYFGDGTPERGPWNGLKRLRWDMSYDLDGGGRGNWGIEWMNANPSTELTALSADNICQSCEHSDGDGNDNNSRLHCVLKGQAAWHLWARMAGWQEEAVVPVTDINVTGAGGVSIIDVDGGTLQMEAEVLPVDATYKSVTWSVVNGTGDATISTSGLLTAVTNGTATAVATSADGLVTGELEVTISNQSTTGIPNSRSDDPEISVYGQHLSINVKQADQSWEGSMLKVFDLKGSQVFTSPLNMGLNEFDIQNGPGVYILLMQSRERSIKHKVFID